jgi:hypothetical protein
MKKIFISIIGILIIIIVLLSVSILKAKNQALHGKDNKEDNPSQIKQDLIDRFNKLEYEYDSYSITIKGFLNKPNEEDLEIEFYNSEKKKISTNLSWDIKRSENPKCNDVKQVDIIECLVLNLYEIACNTKYLSGCTKYDYYSYFKDYNSYDFYIKNEKDSIIIDKSNKTLKYVMLKQIEFYSNENIMTIYLQKVKGSLYKIYEYSGSKVFDGMTDDNLDGSCYDKTQSGKGDLYWDAICTDKGLEPYKK